MRANSPRGPLSGAHLKESGIVLTIFAILVPSPGATAKGSVGGTQLWVSRYNGPGTSDDSATAIAVSPDGSRAFVTGWSSDAHGNEAATGALDASTGASLWGRRHPHPAEDNIGHFLRVSPTGSEVFVAASSWGQQGNLDSVVGAYDASSGDILWTRRYNGPGNGFDAAYGVAVSPDGSTVFSTGYRTGVSGERDYATAAYDAYTGVERWNAYYGRPGDWNEATSIGLSPDGSTLFVTGYATGTSGATDYTTVAYGASSGSTLWIERYHGPGAGDDLARSISVSPDGSKVFVTGNSTGVNGLSDYATVAYDAFTGHQQWVMRYNGPGDGNDTAPCLAMSPDASKVFVTGSSLQATGGVDFATLAYDASTGSQLWLETYDGPDHGGGSAECVAVSPDGTEVFVTGTAGGTNHGDYATVAYDANTGSTVWVADYDGPADGQDNPFDLAVSPDGSKVFVTGLSEGPATGYDYATVAYSA
jgi:hypothetical protein